jgi:hypothetical protein
MIRQACKRNRIKVGRGGEKGLIKGGNGERKGEGEKLVHGLPALLTPKESTEGGALGYGLSLFSQSHVS